VETVLTIQLGLSSIEDGDVRAAANGNDSGNASSEDDRRQSSSAASVTRSQDDGIASDATSHRSKTKKLKVERQKEIATGLSEIKQMFSQCETVTSTVKD
jgi:hypothetical protein